MDKQLTWKDLVKLAKDLKHQVGLDTYCVETEDSEGNREWHEDLEDLLYMAKEMADAVLRLSGEEVKR